MLLVSVTGSSLLLARHAVEDCIGGFCKWRRHLTLLSDGVGVNASANNGLHNRAHRAVSRTIIVLLDMYCGGERCIGEVSMVGTPC